MELKHIDIASLSISPANMRGVKKTPDLTNILPSVRARGILVPLIVRQNVEHELPQRSRQVELELIAIFLDADRQTSRGQDPGQKTCGFGGRADLVFRRRPLGKRLLAHVSLQWAWGG